MDVTTLIRQRLEELDLEQQQLAVAANVTQSYISQLLTGKKPPPAPERTDIYDPIGKLLRLPRGTLSELANLQRKEALKKGLADPPAPLFKDTRDLILRKCHPDREHEVRGIFEKQTFGELERLVTQKLLDVAKTVAKEELGNENWLHLIARLTGRSYEQARVDILEFLDTDIFNLSIENCVAFLDPLIESWDIDLATFSIVAVLSRRLAPGSPKRFEFVEKEADQPAVEPGLTEFLRDPSLSGGIDPNEIEFLRRLRFKGRRPTALYYYRELQSLRDPLHFRT